MKCEYARFIEKVNILGGDECWNWMASTTRGGYGQFRRYHNGKWKMVRCPRYSYEYFNNVTLEDIQGQVVRHTCDNRLCVNPKHLVLGSNLDNIQDKISRGRHRWGNKEGHNVLSSHVVNQIRQYKQDNPDSTYREIGDVFGTSASQVHRVIKHITHKGD